MSPGVNPAKLCTSTSASMPILGVRGVYIYRQGSDCSMQLLSSPPSTPSPHLYAAYTTRILTIVVDKPVRDHTGWLESSSSQRLSKWAPTMGSALLLDLSVGDGKEVAELTPATYLAWRCAAYLVAHQRQLHRRAAHHLSYGQCTHALGSISTVFAANGGRYTIKG